MPNNLNTVVMVGDYLYYATGSAGPRDELRRVKAVSTLGKTCVDGDFTCDVNDLVVLAQRYNASLAEPGAVPAPAAATTSFDSDWAALTNVAAPVTTPIEKREKPKPLFSVKPVAKPAPAKKPAAPRRK